jgi:hypothetical protein
MTKFPSWDFWKYMIIDVNDRGRDFRSTVSIYDWADIVKTDIRNKKFDLDCNKWCRENFWEADQAAAISFDRDPGKIKKHLSEHGYLGADEDNEEECAAHDELVDAIQARQRLIEEAQENKVLPPGSIFRPEMFVDWGKRVGFRVPPEVEKWVNNVERERRGEGKISSIRDTSGKVAGIFFENDDADGSEFHLSAPVNEGELSENEPKQKSRRAVGPGRKEEYNSTGVLLAILMESELIDREQDELTRNLQTLIEKKQIRNIKGTPISEVTVSKRVDDAYVLYRKLLLTPKA